MAYFSAEANGYILSQNASKMTENASKIITLSLDNKNANHGDQIRTYVKMAQNVTK
jgi:hypothetical protein